MNKLGLPWKLNEDEMGCRNIEDCDGFGIIMTNGLADLAIAEHTVLAANTHRELVDCAAAVLQGLDDAPSFLKGALSVRIEKLRAALTLAGAK